MYRDCSARPAQPDVLKTRVLSKALCLPPPFPFFPSVAPILCTVFAFFFFWKKEKQRERKKSENLLSFFFFFQSAWTNEKQTRKRCYSFDTLIDIYIFL